MKSRYLIITLFFLMFLLQASAFADEGIQIKNAWLREAPPTIKIMAGYLEIENSSDKALVLVSAESNEFERIEFHLSQTENNVARMQQQHKIMIAANTTFVFEPNSYHLMLFNHVGPMREGKLTSIKLTFEGGEMHVFDAVVKRFDSTEIHNHEYHH